MELKDFNKDWTHKKVTITDIRKLYQLYIFTVDLAILDNAPLFVNEGIMHNVLKAYYLTNIEIFYREQILNVRWNMWISLGYYIKIDKSGYVEKIDGDPKKYYVSYLEIDGPLGSFHSIYKEKK